MKKISSTKEFKIKATKELDYTKLLFERKARKEMIANHGKIWTFLYNNIVLDDESTTIQEFKTGFILLIVLLPIILACCYVYLFLITILGGVN